MSCLVCEYSLSLSFVAVVVRSVHGLANRGFSLPCYSIGHDERLREKVDEAMVVYDEYVKNAPPPANGEAQEGGDGKVEGGEERPEPDGATA